MINGIGVEGSIDVVVAVCTGTRAFILAVDSLGYVVFYQRHAYLP